MVAFSRLRFFSALGLTAALVGLAACGDRDEVIAQPTQVDAPAMVLDPLAQHSALRQGCTACHAAEPGVAGRLPSMPAADLSGIGQRRTLPWLRAFLSDPDQARRGGHPGDYVIGADRDSVVEDLLHYLVDDSAFGDTPIEVTPTLIAEGERLFQTVGCLPCHPDSFADRDLAAKSSVAQWAAELRGAEHGSGRRPSMKLDPQEALAIAAWLTRDQRSDGGQELLPGLSYRYYESPNWPSGNDPVDWAALEVVATGTATEVHHQYGSRRERYGLVFEGQLIVPADGEYRFRTRSDDGSELFLDGERLVENLGHHAPLQKDSAPIQLTAGPHELRVTFFEDSGGEELAVSWSGPDFDFRPFHPEELAHLGSVPRPEGWDARFAPDSSSAGRGRLQFQALGCASCHASSDQPAMEQPATAPPWSALPAAAVGCLAEAPGAGAPQQFIDPTERAALITLLAESDGWDQPLTATESVQVQMASLGCSHCHLRGGSGGPTPDLRPHFLGTDDLGDEGRYPPALDGVGAKLKEEWLHQVIALGREVRPAMVTRMPAFGPEVADSLTTDFTAADLTDATSVVPAFDKEAARKGWQLVGSDGLNCLICHDVAGHPSLGVHGPDLSLMTERLRLDWFRRWMHNPYAMRPGTRMAVFFPEGRSVLTSIYDGNADRQIDAIWHYLSLGRTMPLPKGLVIDRSAYQLVPVERPIYFGTFMKGLSARVLTVGFPERLSVAFDERHVRLAKVWQGDFMNAQGTWQGRAGQLESPAGTAVIDLTPGPAFAVLAQADADWPDQDPRAQGWHMLGHRRDGEGRPTFRYALGDLQIEETLIPEVAPGAATLRRDFILRSPTPIEGLYLRTLDRGAERRIAVTFRPDPERSGAFRAELHTLLSW